MKHRGRKSAAELATIRLIEPEATRDPQPPTCDASPPPEHLQSDTKACWTLIVTDYELEQYQLHVLQAAGEAWDLYQFARAELAKHGLTYTDDKGMIRPRPEAAIARDARKSFLRAVRKLKLDVPEPKPRCIGGIGVTWEDLQR